MKITQKKKSLLQKLKLKRNFSNSVNQFAETQAAVMEERIEELRFFEDESLSIESSHQTFEVEEQKNNVLELFLFDDEDVLESQSFTFETEEKKTIS